MMPGFQRCLGAVAPKLLRSPRFLPSSLRALGYVASSRTTPGIRGAERRGGRRRGAVRPIAGAYLPYSVIYRFSTHLLEPMTLKASQTEAVTPFGLEDVSRQATPRSWRGSTAGGCRTSCRRWQGSSTTHRTSPKPCSRASSGPCGSGGSEDPPLRFGAEQPRAGPELRPGEPEFGDQDQRLQLRSPSAALSPPAHRRSTWTSCRRRSAPSPRRWPPRMSASVPSPAPRAPWSSPTPVDG
jgi:hypothetical protein